MDVETLSLLTFFSTRAKLSSPRSNTGQISQDKSAKSGMAPSTPKKFPGCDTSEHANARPHEVAIIRDHRLCHAENMLLLRTGGASLALAAARSLMNMTASSLHLPPVSKATTTRRHLSPWDTFSVFCLFVGPSSGANCTIYNSGVWACLGSCSQSAPQRDVHCQLWRRDGEEALTPRLQWIACRRLALPRSCF